MSKANNLNNYFSTDRKVNDVRLED